MLSGQYSDKCPKFFLLTEQFVILKHDTALQYVKHHTEWHQFLKDSWKKQQAMDL